MNDTKKKNNKRIVTIDKISFIIWHVAVTSLFHNALFWINSIRQKLLELFRKLNKSKIEWLTVVIIFARD